MTTVSSGAFGSDRAREDPADHYGELMYGMLTKIVALPGKRTELLEYLRWDAEVAKAAEPGTWRLDVWEAEQEPGVVYVYEAFKDRTAFEVHAANDPYKRWDEVAHQTMEHVIDVIPLTESLASNVGD
jgi:quinol monooxygenase YgiN